MKQRTKPRISASLDDDTMTKLAVIARIAGGQSVSGALRYAVAELYRRQLAEGLIEKSA